MLSTVHVNDWVRHQKLQLVGRVVDKPIQMKARTAWVPVWVNDDAGAAVEWKLDLLEITEPPSAAVNDKATEAVSPALSNDEASAQFETTELYWDCECEVDFIHPKNLERCEVCGAQASEMPDARVNEVRAAGLPMRCVGEDGTCENAATRKFDKPTWFASDGLPVFIGYCAEHYRKMGAEE